MSYIQWGGKRWYQPKPQPRKPDINELMKPLSEKVGTGNIWGSVIMNVQKDGGVTLPPAFDADAAAYLSAVISAGGSLDATISGATDTLFTSLKSAGIYSKLLAFYPMIGATQYSTALNGKRTNSQFDIDWVDGSDLTYDYSGVTGGRSNSITTRGGNTHIIPNNDLTIGSRHMALYVNNTITNVGGYEMGGGDGNDNATIVNFYTNGMYFSYGAHNNIASSDVNGFYYSQVSGSSSPYNIQGFRNGVQKVNSTTIDSGGNRYLSLLCDNRQNPPAFDAGSEASARRMAWASYGDDLTASQITSFETIINDFQTTLGRNIY